MKFASQQDEMFDGSSNSGAISNRQSLVSHMNGNTFNNSQMQSRMPGFNSMPGMGNRPPSSSNMMVSSNFFFGDSCDP